ncbi:MAG: type I secretion system permease/ATPase [Alphaproteobacteria bacterium]|nr:type I secretion system permease/ATPase [Alphaproteobacteria bacterium]
MVTKEKDNLAALLVLIADHYNIKTNQNQLIAGLPLVNGRLTPELFIRAAKKVGLFAKLANRKLSEISSLLLPAVINLKNEDSFLLTKINHKKNTAHIVTSDNIKKTISLSELEEIYDGTIFLISDNYNFDARSEEAQEQKNDHWFWGTIALSWRIYRDVLIASLLINIFALVGPLFTMNVYDRVVPNQAIDTLWVLASGVFLVYIFDFVIRMLRGYFVDIAGKKSDILISANIFERVMGMKLVNRPVSIGAFASNLKDFESIRDFITSATILSVIDLPFVIIFLLVIAYVGSALVFIPIAAIILIILYGFLIQPTLRSSIEKTFKASSQKNATLIEGLNGIETIKTLRMEGAMQSRWERSTAYISEWSIRSKLISSSATNICLFIQQTSIVMVIIYGVYLIGDGEVTMGGLIATVLLTARAISPVSQATNLSTRFYHAKAAYGSLNNIMNQPVERQNNTDYLNLEKIKGDITFEDVSFTYPKEKESVLKNINIKINEGERVGFLGKVGSGKSTIFKLILKLYDPDQGMIKFDGLDSNQINIDELRKHIGYIDQNPNLFFGTLKDNIVSGFPEASDEQMLAVSKLSGVDAFASRHPLGYSMPVGEHGEKLSVGQRQSVAIARALIGQSPILLLDEPTSALDKANENLLKNNLLKSTSKKTLLLITHRTSMLDIVDRIIVVEGGKVVADGPKKDIINSLTKSAS